MKLAYVTDLSDALVKRIKILSIKMLVTYFSCEREQNDLINAG